MLNQSQSLTHKVDKWFAKNTFDGDDFGNLERLVSLKETQGITISLGLPTLNEENTIGEIITTVRGALMDEYTLLDEIVLVDSMSSDKTVAIAESLGVPVYNHANILPEMGSFSGKGEALWKSLHVLTGDIIVWIDTDIMNIHPRFVYGLLGPLLVSQEIEFVKGFYHRPLCIDGMMLQDEGGRVTELVARPLLNLFYPELAGVIQPLAGECAGRRSTLEQMPFFTGYAVEIGLLIDIMTRHGLSPIAQVNLKERIHRNHSLTTLSRMSHAILQAVFDRLDKHQVVNFLHEPNRSMRVIDPAREFTYSRAEDLGDLERPPISSVAAYRKQRQAVEGYMDG